MKYSTDQLREIFVSFFRDRGHTVCPSSPLLASGDPTLLFTAAGMVQFKEYYSADGPLPFTRTVSAQKCLRLSDLENVGKTIRHHTFFEMLGNFSFGDYFKEETIAWAWEFVTRIICLPEERLWASVFEEDDEARRLWEQAIGLPSDKVVSLGKDDNFWGPVGRTGICGPCSEIYIDLGAAAGCGKADCRPGCDCDRFLEFWNLVFPQFYKEEDGTFSPLKKKGIDTGMGLERLAMIVQGESSVYETDALRPIVSAIEELIEREVDPAVREDIAANVVADHSRALAFCIAEGIIPSNEGRGYVLRRLLRRASRRMRTLGAREPTLYRLVGVVVDIMKDVYPELSAKREHIAMVTRAEEERFEKTLELGITRFEELVSKLEASGQKTMAGRDVFTLYDTYGFPPDLTQEMAQEKGFQIDTSGFEAEMEEQRRSAQEKSRFAPKEKKELDEAEWKRLSKGAHSRFVGYRKLEETIRVRRFRHCEGEGRVQLLLDRTPFYGESGGQVGDTGRLSTATSMIEVDKVFYSGKAVVHEGRLAKGAVEDSPYEAVVDAERRLSTARNHTATHLLHHVLRRVLGDHVRQAGSFVAPDRLRFDYTHFKAPSPAELEEIEDLTNQLVLDDTPVRPQVSSYEEAISEGAIALFGEKYGEKVRQVVVGDVSRELCGGTHVERTGQIGHFLIVSDTAIGSGVRRVEAVTGLGARSRIVERGRLLSGIQSLVSGGEEELLSTVSGLVKAAETLRKRSESDEKARVLDEVEKIVSGAEEVSGVKVVAARVDVGSQEMMRTAGDLLRGKLKRGAGVIGTVLDEKPFFLAFVGDALLSEKTVMAGEIAREAARIVGGGGGGKPHMATAGGRDASSLEKALQGARTFILKQLER
ncbi:MAG: alanine--tRNA ligase [Candidatus Eiseniibacteriota bacterium]|nr:MAG: alanine--tRNA ligase [Candidatus Eisenbacteria bacterium]